MVDTIAVFMAVVDFGEFFFFIAVNPYFNFFVGVLL